MSIKTDFNFPLNFVDDESLISGGEFSFPSDFNKHDRHIHESCVLVGVQSGVLGVTVKADSMVINSEVILFIPNSVEHNKSGIGIACEGWFVNIPAVYCKGLPKEPQLYSAQGLLSQLSLRIASWGASNSSQSSESRQKIVQVFLDELQQIEPLKKVAVPVPLENNMNEVVKVFMRDPSSKTTIDDLAKLAGVSRRSFTTRFREQTGVSFGEWKHKVLIQEAIRHLTQGKSVKETASILGYSSVSSFSEKFRKEMKASPMQYLKKRE